MKENAWNVYNINVYVYKQGIVHSTRVMNCLHWLYDFIHHTRLQTVLYNTLSRVAAVNIGMRYLNKTCRIWLSLTCVIWMKRVVPGLWMSRKEHNKSNGILGGIIVVWVDHTNNCVTVNIVNTIPIVKHLRHTSVTFIMIMMGMDILCIWL